VFCAAARAGFKASGLYKNSGWDLVDAVKNKSVKLEALKEAELPEAMRKMNAEQRKKYLVEQAAKRGKIQKEIQALTAKRNEYVKAQIAKQGLSEGKSFDAVLRAMVRAQAGGKGFKFAPAPVPKSPGK